MPKESHFRHTPKAQAAPPPKPPPPPPKDTRVEDAKAALTNLWATSGDIGAEEAANACRKLTAPELRLVAAWIPSGQGLTEQKCDFAREIANAVLEEKK